MSHRGVDVTRGLYSEALSLWLRALPVGSLLVLRMEDYEEDPRGFMSRVLDHLGLGAPEEGDRAWLNILEPEDDRYLVSLSFYLFISCISFFLSL